MNRAVIYYSLSGNTKKAAELIANEINADLIQIEPVKPMPEKVAKQIMVGGMQSSFGLTPEIKGVPKNVAEYDDIIIGTPIWAGKEAAPIHTLIKKYGIADKITAVFTFSGGGDNDKCMASLTKTLNNLKVNVALADRSQPVASENSAKLQKFIEEIR